MATASPRLRSGLDKNRRTGSCLMPEEPAQLDDQNGDYQRFQNEGARVVEFVDHELVELAGGAQLFVHQLAVIGDSDAGRGQAVSAGVEHVAEEFDRIVDALGKLGDLEADLIQALGVARHAPAAEKTAASEGFIDTCQNPREKLVIIAELEQLRIGVLEQLNGRGGAFRRIVY